MANIDEELTIIKEAGGGSEIRGAIVNAIDKITGDINLSSITVTENNKTIQNTTGGAWNKVKVDISPGGNYDSKTVLENGEYLATDDGLDGYSEFTANVQNGVMASAFYESGYTEHEVAHETQQASKGSGCTFSAIPMYDHRTDSVAVLSENPANLSESKTFTYVRKTINRTEIQDDWQTIAAHPENYDIGQWKIFELNKGGNTYYSDGQYGVSWKWDGQEHGGAYFDPLLKMVKVAEYEKPLKFHNGYAKSVWCSENKCDFISECIMPTVKMYHPNVFTDEQSVNAFLQGNEIGWQKSYYRVLLNSRDFWRSVMYQEFGNDETIVKQVLNKSNLIDLINVDEMWLSELETVETLDRIWIPNLDEMNRYYAIMTGGSSGYVDMGCAGYTGDIEVNNSYYPTASYLKYRYPLSSTSCSKVPMRDTNFTNLLYNNTLGDRTYPGSDYNGVVLCFCL